MFAWFRRLRARIRYRSFDADLRQEIDAHRAMTEAELRSRGVAPGEARTASTRAMGNITLAREEARAVWLAPWLESVWQDVKYGVRALLRTPAYTITTLATMVIGVFLNTAAFTFFNTLILRPWPVDHADELAVLSLHAGTAPQRFTLDHYSAIRTQTTALQSVAAIRMQWVNPRTSPGAESYGTSAELATANYFDVLGVPLTLGRFIRADEDRDGAYERVAVISHRLWQRLFAGDPEVLGKPLYFGANAFIVVGVARSGWNGPVPFNTDVWLPLQADREISRSSVFSEEAAGCCISIVGRRAPGARHARVESELTAIVRQNASGQTRDWRLRSNGTALVSQPGTISVVAPILMLASAAIVILLTGANIAHLQVARMRSRRREVQTRLALGAGRWRVARQIVTESLIVATAAGALTLVALFNVTGLFVRLSEVDLPEVWKPDLAIFGYCLLISAVMAIVFGLAPALRSTRMSLVQSSGATPAGRLRFSTLLLTTQIALSTGLLTGAALFTRALHYAATAGVGYTIDDLSVISFSASSAWAATTTRQARSQAIQDTLAAARLPQAIVSDTLPFGVALNTDIRKFGAPPRERSGVNVTAMTANGFAVLGVAFVDGHPYADRLDAAEAVVNERLARRMWPGERAVGQRIVESDTTYTIVGVVQDVHFVRRDAIYPTLFLPSGTMSTQPGVMVRGGHGVTEQVRSLLTSLDPAARITTRTMAEQIALRLGDERDGAKGAWAGGLLALLLAAFGVFGVFTHVVEDRRREIGIRLAMGARRDQVLRALFRSTRSPVLGGLGLGLLVSLSMGPLAQQFLYGLSPFDPVTFAIVAAILTCTGLVATYVPARRALRVDPAVILKQDT